MNPLEKLKADYNNYIRPDDLVKSIILSTDKESIPKDPSIIHQAFYQLKQKGEYKEILKDFIFDLSCLTPFSELLDRVLFRLEISCILKTPNPSYEKYTIDLSEETFERSFNKFSETQKTLIKNMGQSFSGFIN